MTPNKVEITEEESELIDKVAEKIVNSDFDFFALILLQTIKPISWIGGELSYFFLAPFLPLLDNRGYEFIDTFEKRNNIEALIKRIERMHKKRHDKQKKV